MPKFNNPGSIHRHNKVYKPFVLRVETIDEQGRPENVTMIHDEQAVEISGGEWFLVGFIDEETIKRGKELVKENPGPGSPKPTFPEKQDEKEV